MGRMGFDIGSHTVTHVDLGSAGIEQARQELTESKRVLEEQLQSPIRYLAYPYGERWNLRPEIVPLIREAGYEACFSAISGAVGAGQTDFVLPREAVPYSPSVLNLELHLTGCLHWMYALKRRCRAVSRQRCNVSRAALLPRSVAHS